MDQPVRYWSVAVGTSWCVVVAHSESAAKLRVLARLNRNMAAQWVDACRARPATDEEVGRFTVLAEQSKLSSAKKRLAGLAAAD